MRLVICSLALVLAGAATACSQEATTRRHLERGEQFLAAGKVTEAIIEFRNAVERDELYGKARFNLAEAFAINGDFEAAYREYIRAADLLPNDTAAQLKAATYLLLAGQYTDARTRVEQVLAREPKNVDAQVLLGNALAGLKDLDGAVAEIEEALSMDATRGSSYTNLGMLKVAQAQQDAARTAFQRAVEIDPKSIGGWFALANFQWSLGDGKAAETSLKQAYGIDDKNLLANRALAAFYLASGRAREAESHLKFVADTSRDAQSRLALADYYINTNRPADARTILAPLTLEAAAATAARTRLAGLAYVAGQTLDAHRELDTLLTEQPNHSVALLMKARWLLSEGKREAALECARAAVSADPRSAAAYYVRGLAESGSHRSSDAIKSFSDVLRLNPRAAMAQVQLSRLHLMRNSVETAVLFAEEALRLAPHSVDARLALIRSWIARDDVKRATTALAELKKQVTGLAGVEALSGSLQMLLGNRLAARTSFERALQIDAANLEALTGITTLDVVEGRGPLARRRIEAVLAALRADEPAIWLLAAKVFAADDDDAEAERSLRRVITLDPLNIEAFTLLGQLLAKSGRLDEAAAEFAAVSRKEAGNLSAKLMSALIAHAQGNIEAATTRYEEVLRLEPRTALAANNLAAIYAEGRERLDVAQQLAESAADQLPANAEVLDTLGWVYYQRHFLGKAIRQFELSIAVDPDNAVYHYHLGLAHAKNGEPGTARRALLAALKLDPKFTDAQVALATVHE